jgi:transcriptional regulator with XRE-family HTH domain
MPDHGSPAVSQRRLATELRRLRKHARLTGKDVATRLGWSEAKLSRIEHGQSMVKPADLGELMTLYGVAGQHRAELAALAEEARQASPLEEADLPVGHMRYLRSEAEARTMWNWEPQVIPGLLQTEDYTRALLQAWRNMFARPAAEIERRVETRRLRQNVLIRDPAPELRIVIDESVLHRRFGDSSVMYDQLTYLTDISERSNVDLRIFPLAGDQVIGTGAFVYFTFPPAHSVPLPDAVALEHLNGTTFIDDETEVNAYRVAFETLYDNSLNAQATRDMLANVTREKWQ